MVTFLSGGTGTPKLLAGARRAGALSGSTVVGNTGDDVELGGLLVCPDLDTVLFLLGDDGPGERPTASVGCGPNGCAGSVRMSF